MKRRLNLRFLGILLGVLAVFTVGAHFFRGFQVRRTAVAVLALADRAREAGRLDEAIKFYRRYLALKPTDADALSQWGLTLDRQAKSPKDRVAVFFILDSSLRLKDSQDEVRRHLVDVAIAIGRYTDAHDHLVKLLERSPNDASLEHLLGISLEGTGQYKDAATQFESAIKHAPGQIDSYVHLADLYRHQLKKQADADKLMKTMVEDANGAPRAYLARARYFRTGGSGLDEPERKEPDLPAEMLEVRNLGRRLFSALASATSDNVLTSASLVFANSGSYLLYKAEQDVARAREGAADDADVILESAEIARARGWLRRADDFASRGLDKHPKDARMYRLVAELSAQSGRRDQAVKLLRRGVSELPDEFDLPFLLAEMLIDEGMFEEAAALSSRLKDRGIDPAILIYLDGRRKFGGGYWIKAIESLESCYPGLATRHRAMARQVALMLAKCYEQLGDPDQQFAACQRAATADVNDPLWWPAQEGMARARVGMNKVLLAIQAYTELIAHAPYARIIVVRLLLFRTLGLGEKDSERTQNWQAINGHLRILSQQFPTSTEVKILRAQATAGQAKYEEAVAILEKAQEDDPSDALLWVARAGLEGSRQKTPKNALTILDEAEGKLGKHVEIQLARIRLYLKLDSKEAVALLARLEKGLEESTPPEKQKDAAAEKMRLLRALADAYTFLGETRQARRVLGELARRNRNDLSVWIALYDLALVTGDEDSLDSILKEEIRRIEGENGTLGMYAQVARIIGQALRGKNGDLETARRLLITLASRRPNWSRLPVCQARIALLESRSERSIDLAIRNYQRAIDLGERNPLVLRETWQLLHDSGRDKEADELYQNLPPNSSFLDQSSSVVVDLALRNRDLDRAKIVAEKAVIDNPKDFRNHILVAQVYLALDDKDRAEEALQSALKMAEDKAEPWAALVLFYVRMKQIPKAEETLRAAKAVLKEDKNRLAFAGCHEALGQKDQAQRLYKEAVGEAERLYKKAVKEERPDVPALRLTLNVALNSAALTALRHSQNDEAKKYLGQILDLKDLPAADKASARRFLALIVATDTEDNQQKRDLLGKLGFLNPAPEAADNESTEDKRLRAVILAAQRRRRDREEAIHILEGIPQPRLNTADELLLAQLHKSLDRWPRARTYLENILARDGENVRCLAFLADSLLTRPEEALEAEPYIAALEKMQGKAWGAIRLRALLLHVKKQDAEAVSRITNYAEGKDIPVLRAAAFLLEQIEQKAAAEAMYKQFEKKSGTPDAAVGRAGFLGRTGRLDESLAVYDEVRAKVRAEQLPALFTLALDVLYTKNPEPAHLKRVETWIQKAYEGAGNDADRSALRGVQAALFDMQGRFKDSQEMYERCLRDNPRDALARNNLAWLLATTGGNPEQALEHIQEAIKIGGSLTMLLDTRGVVYLALGKAELAYQDLDEVALDQPSGVSLFHLAQAQHARNKDKEARGALRRALELGLKETDLQPFELKKYRELRRSLEVE